MPDTTTYTRCMPENSKPTKIQVYAWYMQRPFRFNLAISTAKNLACVGHTSWYKSYEFLQKFQILVYIWHTLRSVKGSICLVDTRHIPAQSLGVICIFLLGYLWYMPYTYHTPANVPSAKISHLC